MNSIYEVDAVERVYLGSFSDKDARTITLNNTFEDMSSNVAFPGQIKLLVSDQKFFGLFEIGRQFSLTLEPVEVTL